MQNAVKIPADVLDFVREHLEVDALARTPQYELYEAYDRFCRDRGLRRRAFVGQIVFDAIPGLKYGDDTIDGKKRVVVVGLRLRS